MNAPLRRKRQRAAKSKGGSSPLEKLTKDILPTVGVITGSLSGTGIVFTAVGYLAERSHLAMLGFTNVPVDLNQYLYTGLKIVALLPTIVVLAGFLATPWFVFFILAILITLRLLLKLERFDNKKKAYERGIAMIRVR